MLDALNQKIIKFKAANSKQIRHNYILPHIIHIMFQILIACLVINASGSDFDISNSKTKISGETATISFDFNRPAGIKVESVNLIAACKDDTFTISRLMPETVKNALLNDTSGKVSFTVPVKYFPRGQDCEFKLKTELVSGKPNRVLQIKDSRAGLVIKDIQGSDLEIKLRFRYVGDMGGTKDQKRLMICLRAQSGICWGSWRKWKFCILDFLNGKEVKVERVYLGKWPTLKDAPFSYSDGKWHNVCFRMKGKQYEATIDDRIKLSGVESENFSSKGSIGLGVFEGGFWVDDITVTDLILNKVIYKDDFERDKIGWDKRWKTKLSGWPSFGSVDDPDKVMFIKPETLGNEYVIGSVRIPPMDPNMPSLPNVEVKKYGAGVRMTINGKAVLPLIYSFNNTTYQPLLDDSYSVVYKMYKHGMRLYAPTFYSQLKWASAKKLDFDCFDKTMRRLAIECPKGYMILRLRVNCPPDLPEGDFIKSSRRVDDPLSNKDRKTRKNSASLSSVRFREAFISAYKQTIEHINTQPYRDRIIGALLLGGGFESSWGNIYGGIYIDTSPVAIKSFSDYTVKKYKTQDAIKKAWGMSALNINNVPLPGLEERTSSDIAGFRDPSKPKSRWVTDFLEFNGTESDRCQVTPIFDSIKNFWPSGFFGVFRSASHYGGFGAQNVRYDNYKQLDNPGFKFAQGCLNYRDRKSGGVSFYTNPIGESMRLRGKLNLGETDIRTHRAQPSSHRETSAYDTCQTMWREFGKLALAQGQGLWYYGGSRSAGWWDDADLLNTIEHQEKIGNAAVNTDLKDANIAEALVVMDNYSWKYFAATPEPLNNIDENTLIAGKYKNIVNDLALLNHFSIQRMGAAKNYILIDDFFNMDMKQYKLFIFPSTFYCDKKERKRILSLVENGATVMFFFGAGIVNGVNSRLQNMSELLDMNIAVAPPGKLDAKIVKNDNPLCRGINPGTVVGNKHAEWHRFYIDDPTATVLARYDDGKAAMATKKLGKGSIIYSAVTALPPAIYRNAARMAGVHVYSDVDEALYASKRFLVVNTSAKSAGERNFKLPEKVLTVYEVISGRMIAKDIDHFKDKLKNKETAIYYLGKNPQFIEAIKSNAKMNDK